MSEALNVVKEVKGDVLFLRLKGVITEDSRLEQLTTEGKKNIVIDLDQVTRINSYGIRQWINTLKATFADAECLVFTKCRPVIVEQFNMISNFGGGGLVYSFYLPFVSGSSGDEHMELFELKSGEVPPTLEKIPELVLGQMKNKSDFEFNDIEDEYFSFLESQRSKKIPQVILSQV